MNIDSRQTLVVPPLPTLPPSTDSAKPTDPTGSELPLPAADIGNNSASSDPLMRVLRLDDRGDSRVAAISDWIGRGIIEGRLGAGDDLNSVDLAKRFDTSRTPVREALLLLEKEGLVEIPPRRRPRVARTTPTQIREIYTVRATLLGLVAERVAATISPEQLDELRALVDTMSAAAAERDLNRYFWTNVTFHDRTSEIADNQTLTRILDSLGLRVLALRHHSMSLPHRIDESIQDHRRLLRAFGEHDIALAGALNRSLVLAALAALEASRPEETGAT